MAELPPITVDGLQLPVHDSDDVLWREAQYTSAAEDGLESFVRLARPFGYAPDISLSRRLQHIDAALQIIASHCEAAVVPYQWGVCADQPEIFKDYPRADAEGLLPQAFY